MVRLKLDKYEFGDFEEFMSQFHYGSIKTFLVAIVGVLITVLSQFHYGSIKTISFFPLLLRRGNQSQFHYGSIKTSGQSKNCKNREMCLNSTMVRLKLLVSLTANLRVLSLNSTMVRLKQKKFLRLLN